MMKKMRFLVIFGLVAGSFCFCGCSGAKWIWCTSNGIFTYDRHTGRIELLWENSAQPLPTAHDTVFNNVGIVCKTDSVR